MTTQHNQSVRTLITASLLLLLGLMLPVSVFAQKYTRIAVCNERLAIQEDGSAQVTTALIVTDSSAELLAYPMMFGKQEGLQVLPESVSHEYQLVDEENDRWVLSLTAPGVDTVTLSYTVPNVLNWDEAGPFQFNSYKWGYSFSNWSNSTIDIYQMDILLPQGWNYHRVLKSMPEMDEKETFPPYNFLKDENRDAHLLLIGEDLKLGDECSVSFVFKPVTASTSMIMIGIVLCILYLWYFRFLLVKAKQIETDENQAKANS